jgi:hypothetical protein
MSFDSYRIAAQYLDSSAQYGIPAMEWNRKRRSRLENTKLSPKNRNSTYLLAAHQIATAPSGAKGHHQLPLNDSTATAISGGVPLQTELAASSNPSNISGGQPTTSHFVTRAPG